MTQQDQTLVTKSEELSLAPRTIGKREQTAVKLSFEIWTQNMSHLSVHLCAACVHAYIQIINSYPFFKVRKRILASLPS